MSRELGQKHVVTLGPYSSAPAPCLLAFSNAYIIAHRESHIFVIRKQFLLKRVRYRAKALPVIITRKKRMRDNESLSFGWSSYYYVYHHRICFRAFIMSGIIRHNNI